jgi:hypothetical protein
VMPGLCNELCDFVMNGVLLFCWTIAVPKLLQSSDVFNYCESSQPGEFV